MGLRETREYINKYKNAFFIGTLGVTILSSLYIGNQYEKITNRENRRLSRELAVSNAFLDVQDSIIIKGYQRREIIYRMREFFYRLIIDDLMQEKKQNEQQLPAAKNLLQLIDSESESESKNFNNSESLF